MVTGITGISFRSERNSTKKARKNLIEAISIGHSIAKIVRNLLVFEKYC